MVVPEKRGFTPGKERPGPKKIKNNPLNETGLVHDFVNRLAYIDLTIDDDSRISDSAATTESRPLLATAPSVGVYDTCFGLIYMQATSRGWEVPRECTPVTLRLEGRMVWITSKATNDCVAVLVSETLSCIVREFAVTLAGTVCGKKGQRPHASTGPLGVGMSNETGPRFLSLRLIVYGFMQQKDAIADVLAEGGLFLQHPGEWEFDQSVKYVNPQYLLGPGQEMPPLEELSIATCCVTRGPRLAQVRGTLDESTVSKVQKIFDTSAPRGIVGEIEPSPRLVTQLKRHQNEALVMMIEKEEGIYEKARFPTMWKASRNSSDRVIYQNIVTELFDSTHPPPLGGGILADEMGLGKTLSSLSIVCHYLDKLDQSPYLGQKISRSTLIVTPKSTIFEWEKQIKLHIHPGKVRWTIYHGSNRQETACSLGQYDIVLTTYDTLRPEETTKGPLFENEWARVILDEAHRIRNRNSKTFTAVCGLRSRHRWCLTGTPIQNCLDDFGALLAFIKTPSLHTKALFEDFIARPMQENRKNGIAMLQKVVAATCLRRTKNNHLAELDLPRKLERLEYVTMDRDDRELYEFFKRFSFLTTKGGKTSQKEATNILALISMLRLICDHGEALLTDKAIKAWRERDEKLLSWGILKANVVQCVSCQSQVEGAIAGNFSIDELSCGHVLCDSCTTESQNCGYQSSCPGCSTTGVSSVSFNDEPGSQRGSKHSIRRQYPPSAKVEAVLHNISKSQEGNAPNIHPRKAVIFSYWTKMLDLIGNTLDERGLAFQRIDGQSSLPQRKDSIEKFSKDSQCSILLASIGAAGEGIDLTTANSVHIMEPHWNPMVESQAVDRVHRIGQKQDVEVVRYIVQDSIELYVRWVQNHKLEMIRESLSSTEQIGKTVSDVRWKKLLEFLE
ncbi:SNF2 family N-terminal domain-containing protein [Aspergillus stella-maris]|uniref:SNF2 family N-terminal domain-containing protein n=1 Tax=Aspergillus stella-maris TaxID=1810926 RepID=UPI003CCE08DD